MVHHEVVENNVKELSYALVGVLAVLSVVLLIGISAFLRPVGNHVDVETAQRTGGCRAAASAAQPPQHLTCCRRQLVPRLRPTQTPQPRPIPQVAFLLTTLLWHPFAPIATAKHLPLPIAMPRLPQLKAEIKEKQANSNIAAPVASAVKSQAQSK